MYKRNYTTLATVNEICGFFTVYKAIKTDHFKSIFGDVDDTETQALNDLLTDVQGDCVLMENYEKIFTENNAETMQRRLCNAVDLLFYEQWKDIKATIDTAKESDFVKPLAETKTKTTERQGTASDNRQNKTNAFDDTETASDTDSSNGESEHAETVTETEEIERSNGLTVSENAKKRIDFVRYNDLLTMILADIKKTACLAIYS